MIYSLRKKFIIVSAASIVTVFSVIFAVMFITNRMQLNKTMDMLTDAIAKNGGMFPEYDGSVSPPPGGGFPISDVITEETRFSTRFFTVWLDEEEQIVRLNMDFV